MAEEEFQESEIIFQDNAADGDDTTCSISRYDELSSNDNMQSKKKKKSVPVNIPKNYMDFDNEYDFNDDDGDGRITPPHLILGRRTPGKMAFSVYSGDGRALKGRHLNEVRNSILRMTGFLEM